MTPNACFGDLRAEVGFAADDPTNRRNCPARVELVGSDITVEGLEHLFRERMLQQRFPACVCITESGEALSPLLGLVTAHNLPSANAYARARPHERDVHDPQGRTMSAETAAPGERT